MKTQCRVKEFTTQKVGQYYNIKSLNKAFKCLDMRAKREESEDVLLESNGDEKKPYLVQGKYTVEYNKRLENHGLDQTLLNVLEGKFSEKNLFWIYMCHCD